MLGPGLEWRRAAGWREDAPPSLGQLLQLARDDELKFGYLPDEADDLWGQLSDHGVWFSRSLTHQQRRWFTALILSAHRLGQKDAILPGRFRIRTGRDWEEMIYNAGLLVFGDICKRRPELCSPSALARWARVPAASADRWWMVASREMQAERKRGMLRLVVGGRDITFGPGAAVAAGLILALATQAQVWQDGWATLLTLVGG